MNNDTVELLKECSSGIKMGIRSIDSVIDYVKDDNLRQSLASYKDKHCKLEQQTRQLLHEKGSQTEEPPLTAKGMAWAKTNIKLTMDSSDSTCAELITDGCDMGVKSLNRYLNQYESANHDAKGLAKDLIRLEENLCEEMKTYL